MRRRTRKNIALRKNTARGLLFFNALLWLIYGGRIYFDMAIVNNNKTSADIAAVILFMIALLMSAGGILLGKRSRRIYYVVLVIVILNLLFALSNLSDLWVGTAFMVDLVILAALIPLREDYSSI